MDDTPSESSEHPERERETTPHLERRERRIHEKNLYIASDEDDPSTEEEDKESQEPEDLPPAENPAEPDEDDWLCPACGSSPCEFIQAQEEMERVVSIMAVDASQASKRFHTYRFMTCQLHGQLSSKQRIPLPPCCQQGIADLFPSEDGNYRGFRHANA
jgi:rubredoxin